MYAMVKIYLFFSVSLGDLNQLRHRSWLTHCATSWKVTGSIPDGVIAIFH